MKISLIFMWLIATGCSYLFGVSLGIGIIAIYSCMIIDEYVRGVLSFFRWRGRKHLRMKEADLQKEREEQQCRCNEGMASPAL
ncbi:MATE family multidrug exporter [compost metagenome]